jgi:hypothetical protein
MNQPAMNHGQLVASSTSDPIEAALASAHRSRGGGSCATYNVGQHVLQTLRAAFAPDVNTEHLNRPRCGKLTR